MDDCLYSGMKIPLPVSRYFFVYYPDIAQIGAMTMYV